MKKTWKNIGVTLLLSAISGMAMAQQQASIKGEVRRIDVHQGKIVIKQGAVSDFKLPAMTLVYEISQRLLSGIKAGDKVKFTATLRADNHYQIDEIEVDD